MFKTFSGQVIDLEDYVRNYVETNENVTIGVCTDSIARGKRLNYATVVVLYRKGKGGHVLFERNTIERYLFGIASQKDFQKLYHDTVLTQSVVERLSEFADIIEVNLDFNADSDYFSNTVLLASIGWFKAQGVDVKGKPCQYAHVADKFVRIA